MSARSGFRSESAERVCIKKDCRLRIHAKCEDEGLRKRLMNQQQRRSQERNADDCRDRRDLAGQDIKLLLQRARLFLDRLGKIRDLPEFRLHASYETAVCPDGSSLLSGEGPVRLLQNYAAETASYTRGTGSFSLSFNGYQPSEDQEKLVGEAGYDALSDSAHPSFSIFCQHDNALTETLSTVRFHLEQRYPGQDLSEIQKRLHLSGAEISLKDHCLRGEDNVRSLPFYPEIQDAILYHHENADGSGAFGLRAAETPLIAQLIHLADQIDVRYDLSEVTQQKHGFPDRRQSPAAR